MLPYLQAVTLKTYSEPFSPIDKYSGSFSNDDCDGERERKKRKRFRPRLYEKEVVQGKRVTLPAESTLASAVYMSKKFAPTDPTALVHALIL